jgi:nucleoside-diphosphate-sugar epimerase
MKAVNFLRQDRTGSEKMKIVVLGANGRTGELVVREALAKGETVTAVVRSEAKRPSTAHGHLNVVIGDPCDPKFLTEVFRNQDVVISTLGGRYPTKKATSIYWMSANAITEAAWNTGVKNIVVTSTALLFPPKRWLDRLLAVLVRNVVQSAMRMEQRFCASDLNVVFARCGFLTDADERGYRAERGSLPKNGSAVSRKGFAQFLVDTAQNPFSGHQAHGVSGPVD